MYISSAVSLTVLSVSKCIPRPTAVVPAPFPTRNGRLPDAKVTPIVVYTNLPTFSTTTLLPSTTTSSSCTTSTSSSPVAALANNRDTVANDNDKDGGQAKRDLPTIFCPTKNCIRARDWLTSIPNAVAAWSVSGIALILSGLLLMSTIGWRNPGFLDGVLAMLEVALSLVLRASIGYATSDGVATAIYRASMFFNYHAGVQLCHLLSVMVLDLSAHFDPRITAKQIFAKAVSRLLSLCLLALTVAAVVVMFNGDPTKATTAGLHMVQAVVFVVLVISLVMAMAAAQIVAREGSVNYRKHIVAAILPLLLLALWAGFMASRTFVSLDNVARSNEIMLYFLNYVPLLMIGATLILLNAPRLFNFEKLYH
ncbi:hypothetical protein GGI01_002345 [Coemansia sp. RSA 376]|nr:hypothetical protein GGI14_000980 [Coemansia sp. S680]KAJ2075661.1 hypothetical protein GGH13_000461 [Coemansia sp. S155-1]KAJ2103470.1 hypothetical protein GGI09_000650 [Coemansia sp. S100]KAJ2261301.1 hypothetical protein GGI01_002391 [Coemansia sp. RSA 376]KAJ2261354.1 hypothetical protein GGI01_002345 [Coemansia sp. RSA 376]